LAIFYQDFGHSYETNLATLMQGHIKDLQMIWKAELQLRWRALDWDLLGCLG